MLRRLLQPLFIIFVIVNFTLAPVLPALAQNEAVNAKVPESSAPTVAADQADSTDQSVDKKADTELPLTVTYTDLMRRVNAVKKNDTSRLPVGETKDIETLRGKTVADLEKFIRQEKDHLDTLGVGLFEGRPYLKLLKKQLAAIDNRPPTWWQKMEQFFVDLFSEAEIGDTVDVLDPGELKLPPHPGSFGFTDDKNLTVTPITNVTATVTPGQNPTQFFSRLKNWKQSITLVPSANALDDQYLPTIDDVRSDFVANQANNPNNTDVGEVVINTEISDLAASLDNNPVSIFNYVRNAIRYEPYYGAKKGSIGCLRERLCNDVDSSSLTIALLRSAGIPARYRKGIAIMKVAQINNLLGVDETRTTYMALSLVGVPTFTIAGGGLGSVNASQYDFSVETHLALEWTFPEAFVRYDEDGGNYSSILSFATATSTESIRAALRALSPSNSTYTKQQWLSMDTILKPYQRTDRPILADQPSANWNPETFFTTFLSSYTGSATPIEKYRQDLLTSTGQDINNNRTTKAVIPKNYTVLPPTLPYFIGSGTVGSAVINQETWSKLPDERRYQVAIELRREQNPSDMALAQTFFGSAINNQPIDLIYKGATTADEQIIASYGGIHQTPATLVALNPVLTSATAGLSATTNNTVTIGEALITRFVLSLPVLGTQAWRTGVSGQIEVSDKFSTGGDSEGIYIALSRVQPDPTLDTNEKILLSGPAALARAYLLRVEQVNDELEESLSYESQLGFARAVVTQNRILNRVNGLPTTFDFKGFSIDATTSVTDYSNVGRYDTHRETFRRLWGLEASYNEAKLFEDIAGLQSISTVKGLQYAYQNPQTYTVYTISSSTANYQQLIQSLNLSQNTKDNILNDVQNNNNTVVVPNSPVTLGTFTGVLYASLSPVWMGNYAIGEQVGAKGGYSAAPVVTHTYQNQSGQTIDYQDAPGPNNTTFVYQDSVEFGSISCRPDNAWRTQMEARPDWRQEYGFACTSGQTQFGDEIHYFIVAGNATKFNRTSAYHSPGTYDSGTYDYWVHHDRIKTQVEQYLDGRPQIGARYPYRFSFDLGTYLRPACVDETVGKCISGPLIGDNDLMVYYSPYQNGNDIGRVYRLDGNFLDKATADDNAIIKILGFPVNDRQAAAASPYGTTGDYQTFVNGQMFFYEKWDEWDSVQYTYGKIYQEHDGNGGTAGTMGFPHTDPILANGFVFQEFEAQNEYKWDLSANQVTVEAFKKYRCELDRHWDNAAYLGFVGAHGVWDTGVQTVDDIASLAGGVWNKATSPSETYAEAQALAQAVTKINFQNVRDFLGSTANSAYTYLLNEYDTSFGPNGCVQRQAYLKGRLAGEILLLFIPASKLKAIEKVQAIKIAQKSKLGVKALKVVGKWLEYRSDIIAYIARLPAVKASRFRRSTNFSGIKHVLLGDFDESGKFLSGLHSPRTLKSGMDNGMLDIWSANGGAKYTKFSDIPVDANGVRKIQIRHSDGTLKFKSIFPDSWSDDDILDAIIEATDSGGLQTGVDVSRNGVTVNIRGFLNNNLIDSGFPN